MSSASSSSSSSASEEGSDGDGRRGEYERPSSSRQRFDDGVWPEPFIEALAYQVAIDAARTLGRLAAAPAIASVFQVCSTWRAISRSDQLWERLVREIWTRDRLLQDTWHEEYMYRHGTANNFFFGRAVYATLDFDGHVDPQERLTCRCVALSDYHVACGFDDGAVRVFDLSTKLHIRTFHSLQRNQLGIFSQAVIGIVLTDLKLVFASLNGDIHVAYINGDGARRVQFGNTVNDGVLASFSGCSRWWVGLFAGSAGRAIHVWDSQAEQLVYEGRSLTDPETLAGWRMLAEFTRSIGRVRVTSQGSALASTSTRVMVFDLEELEAILPEREWQQEVLVDTVDVHGGLFLTVDGRRAGRVRRVDTFEHVCRFRVRREGAQGRLMGCINGGYVFIWVGGEVRVWELLNGGHLYNIGAGIAGTTALEADERHLVACSTDGTIHIWDFGAF